MATQKQYDAITNWMIDALDEGYIPWRRPWANATSGNLNRPHNAATGHTYKGLNPLILSFTAWRKGYLTNQWLTYLQAESLGGNVIRGERSTLVSFWKIVQAKKESEDDKPNSFPVLKMPRLFNVAQCENLKLPNRENVAPEDPKWTPQEKAQSIIDSYIGKHGPKVMRFGGDDAFYSPSHDFIQMPEQNQFANPDGFYAVAFHEMGHSTGHSSRLQRFGDNDKSAKFGSPVYSKEELIAEMTSAFLADESGIESTLKNSAAYIKNWLRVLQNDRKMVVTAASAAQKAADLILTEERS